MVAPTLHRLRIPGGPWPAVLVEQDVGRERQQGSGEAGRSRRRQYGAGPCPHALRGAEHPGGS